MFGFLKRLLWTKAQRDLSKWAESKLIIEKPPITKKFYLCNIEEPTAEEFAALPKDRRSHLESRRTNLAWKEAKSIYGKE